MPICSAITIFLRINGSLVCPFEHSFRSKQILSDGGRGALLVQDQVADLGSTLDAPPPPVSRLFFIFMQFLANIMPNNRTFHKTGADIQLLFSGSAAWRAFKKKYKNCQW